MKKVPFGFIVSVLLVFIFVPSTVGQPSFNQFFKPNTLRINYSLAGDINHTEVFFKGMSRVDGWAGSRVNLLDTFNYGVFKMVLRDASKGEEIYSRGFCTLYQEWLTTPEAKRMKRSFQGVALVPYPRHKAVFELYQRNKEQVYQKIFTMAINPNDYFISREQPLSYPVDTILWSGMPATHLDIAFLAEGYTRDEIEDFYEDARRLADTLLHTAPYNLYKRNINILAVGTPSTESGTDVPGERIYKKTAFHSTFYTFNVARYLTVTDLFAVYDHLSGVAADQVIILVNSERYGGGGVFNNLTVCTSDHVLSPKVIVHEFGHAFAGLGDEYYTSSVAYEDYYNLKMEPWEPNLTTLVHFERKWKDMLDPGIPVPTPDIPKYYDKVGVFEGGGYVSKGVYRPFHDCRMKSNSAPGFCPVCQRAISRMIMFYSK